MWKFLSRNHGETEGYSQGSIAGFKGNPLQALTREICQNSLDATDGSGNPVIIEFDLTFMNKSEFPGMDSMQNIINACFDFWKEKGDQNTKLFLDEAKKELKNNKVFVLRISDFNTTGVRGAFSDENITPWGGLVKGNAFSVKSDDKNAAGSYGIGKAAPFACSKCQTVFYRTLDDEGIRAAMGVARLMAHNSIGPVTSGEDLVRRSVGYYGCDCFGKPAVFMPELDRIYERTQRGTDIFIPCFTAVSSNDKWKEEIIKEVLDNFLYSIYIGKLEIKIEKWNLNSNSLCSFVRSYGSKDAKNYYDVIRTDNESVYESTKKFYNLGTLKLRLLYESDLNKNILVVRSSGMRIAKISALPKHVSYTGFLELLGSELNSFFRQMENPSHSAWDPQRHQDKDKAKRFKHEVEEWVVNTINEKLMENSGSETDVDIGDCFNFNNNEGLSENNNMKEWLSDKTKEIKSETYIPQLPKTGKISIRDEGNTGLDRKSHATDDPEGEAFGHRHRTGTKPGGKPTGRSVAPDSEGKDSMYSGNGGNNHEVLVKARIISNENGHKKLIITSDESIKKGRIEIVAKGENGRAMRLYVSSVSNEYAKAENGCIVLENLKANVKTVIEFELIDNHNYAMGVRAYGN